MPAALAPTKVGVGEERRRPEPGARLPWWDLSSSCCETLGKCLKRV